MGFRDTVEIRRFAILAAAVTWGTMGFAKAFLPAGTSPAAVGAVRLLGGAAVLGLLCRPGTGTRAVIRDRGIRRWMLIGGAAMAVSQALYFTAMTSAGVAVGAVATLGTVPVFGGLLVALTRRRRPSPVWVVSTALALGGGVALALGGPPGRHLAVGVGEGVCAGLAYTIFTESCAQQVRRGGRSATVMALTLGIAGILLSPVLVMSSLSWLGTVLGLLIAVYLAVVTTALTYLAYGWGLRTTSLDLVATLLLAEPATAAMLGILILHEPSTRWTWSGLILIGIGLVILARRGAEPVETGTVASRPVGLPLRPVPRRVAGEVRRHAVVVVVTRRGGRYVARCLEPELKRSGRSLARSLDHLRSAVEHQLAHSPGSRPSYPLVTWLDVEVPAGRGHRCPPAAGAVPGPGRCHRNPARTGRGRAMLPGACRAAAGCRPAGTHPASGGSSWVRRAR